MRVTGGLEPRSGGSCGGFHDKERHGAWRKSGVVAVCLSAYDRRHVLGGPGLHASVSPA